MFKKENRYITRGVNEKTFEYSSTELLGVMRFDFYDGGLANQWNYRDLII